MINSESRFEHGEMGGGLLSGEYDNTGALIREVVWLNGEPLAQIDKSGGTETVTYLHTDHLATPRYGTNAAGTTVWTWDSGAFGKEVPTGTATVNLRFPGQYFDSESTLYYNWNRYYNPATGRYISSDPIGLFGGINTFNFVQVNPLLFVDLFGLEVRTSPDIEDQYNPQGERTPGKRDYTKWIEQRFPKTIVGSKLLLAQRIVDKICELWNGKNWPKMIAGMDSFDVDVDITDTSMTRFGDDPQTIYESNVKLGEFELKTDPVRIKWENEDKMCSRCFTYKTTMYVWENAGSNWIPGFKERQWRYGEWPLEGRECCSVP